ncbi:ShlB/FhaC/HecB family hemolysin secretion/activation protein [uncultured Polaribacter sp.]|uniref:ShlB/FhaC/HecB family hemolysin secretion/activation protein n=1 Tax=uncultured Polaribacter sp. TaxID=174711 RepID=UPI00261E7D10|nr:ShlB/FhaC/HecB family hemolysin secretion/activation protein [uncultured Polaribacter sp.]
MIILCWFSFDGLFAQEITLKIIATNTNESEILNEIDYVKNHKDSISLYAEIYKISDYLKNIGYFTHTIDSIKNSSTNYIGYFSLSDKIEHAIIKVDSNSEIYFEDLKLKDNFVTIPIEALQNRLSTISKRLDTEGKSFSKVQLKDISIKGKILYGNLKILLSKKRIINKIIIKDYEDFPKSYLKNYFNISSLTVFNQQKIKEISLASKSLQFIKEIKAPEVLFTKDSTLLYLYLKKQQNNSFDGIVNFTTKENGDLLFNGNINLKLNNILNTGEKFELFWNSIGEERQEFKVSTNIPYIFNSKFSPEISFSIYKQDSTFLNTKFDSKLFYNINPKTKLAITYTSESSENLIANINNNIETFSNSFLGFQFQYNIAKNDYFFNDKFNLEINPSIGKRTTNNNTLNQFKIEASTSYIWDVSLRSSIFFKNETGYLNSDSFIENELFRIGGANSIRGFNEQSIFTNNYTYFNVEFRYLTSEKSYLYTITDIGRADINSKNNNLLGVGLGYLFSTKNSQINIGLVLGNVNSNQTSISDTKFIINWTNFF